MYPDVSSLGIFKRLAVIEFQINLMVGKNPREKDISAVKEILKASEYDGMKVIKFRIIRYKSHKDSPVSYGYMGVEKLEILVA